MTQRERPSFTEMCRSLPVRTGVFTLGPPAVGFAQLWNAVVHDVPVLPVAAIATVMVVFSVLVTSYHLAVFRRSTLTSPHVDR